MVFRYILIVFALLISTWAISQKAGQVIREETRDPKSAAPRACTNDAGTIDMGTFIGQSNRHDIQDTIFLCWQDRFFIDHNKDFDLGGDPDPSTAPGIGYAWYDGVPTRTGPDLNAIEADPEAYMPAGELVVYVDELDGDALFENAYYTGFTTFNEYISGGNITEKYFAPITFDRRVGSRALYEGSPAGECVNARVDQAFHVVYLNPIEISNVQTQFMGVPNRVQLTLTGGMSEFDASEYTQVEIQLKNKPSVTATIQGSGFSHGSILDFTVPEYGLYEIIVRDEITCEKTIELNIQENTIPVFVLDTLTGQPGDIVCVTWSVKDFEGIQFIFGGLKFDPTVVQFSSFTGLNFHQVEIGTVIGPDQISIQWIPLNDLMYTLPDGEQLAEICFEIVGDPGDCTPLYFHNMDAVFTDDFGGGDCTPNQETGLICVDPPVGLFVQKSVCGSRDNVDEGTITFQVFGGTPPYDFVLETSGGALVIAGTLTGGEGKVTLYDIPAGFNYRLIVTDDTGTTFIEDVDIITIDEPLTVDFINVKPPTCFGDSDGQVAIQVSGSAVINPGDYSVEWSTNDYAVNNLIQLSNGTYCVTVTEDFTGCQTEACINLEVEPLNLQLSILDTAFCADSGGGRVLATVNGGTPETTGYNYLWASGSGNLSAEGFSSEFTDLSPGMVYIEMYDTYRYCKLIDSIEMPYLYDLEVNTWEQDPLCYNEKTGQLGIKATLGNYAGGNYNFFPIPPFVPKPQNFVKIGTDSLFVDSLGQGFYRIEITELNTGCSTVQQFLLSNPSELQSSILTDDLGCQPNQMGSAQITVRGGNDPYVISSSSGLPDANVAFATGWHLYDDLDEGTYYITITDSVGCAIQDTFEINGTDELLSIDSLVYQSFECIPNPKTDITAFASSTGVGIFYLWKNESGAVIDVDRILNNIGPGKYYLEVSDSNGCEAVDSVELFEPDLFSLDILISEPECAGANGGDPGYICVNPIGGTPGFSFQWTDGTPPDQPCLENLAEGSYTLLVTDVNNCRVDTVITLGGPSEINVDILDVAGISCNDGQTFDGSVTLTASGGNNPASSYSFELSSGTSGFGQVHVANDLEGGQNWALVSFNTLSGNVCYADTVYFDVTVPAVLELDFGQLFIQDVSCFGDCDGIAIVGATGGNGLFYRYDWIETGQIGAAASDLCADTYHIRITDANGCEAMDSITVNQPDSLAVAIDPANTNGINCFGQNTGQIQIVHQGGNIGSPFTYAWENTDADGPFASGLAPGYYSVTVTDAKGCFGTAEITLDEQEPVLATVPAPDPILCFGDQTCITVETASGGAGPDYRFSVNGGPLFDLGECVAVFASEQAYQIEVFDKDGCAYTTTVQIDQPAEIQVFLDGPVEVGLGESAILNAQITSDNPIQLIEWSPLGPLDVCRGQNCQQLEVHPDSDETYLVEVTDIYGCTGSTEVDVRVNTRRNVYLPNAFSPNGDAYNEKFQIFTGNGVSRINYFRVFDRWGELVYNETNLTPNPAGVGNWDGTFRGKKLSPGVFVYMVEVEFIDDRTIIYRGSVTLLR